ncbi:hypothetical protein CEXT_345651 [Caerostris extrusa]|uniref:Uncharacterized protein n=1 Tax=Caerostris extrusa TaxID=172846 RepID=A0AAV4PT17_CAEEX|nr:hypothetical protein CEXT_345651 [Caerostris extrusa]
MRTGCNYPLPRYFVSRLQNTKAHSTSPNTLFPVFPPQTNIRKWQVFCHVVSPHVGKGVFNPLTGEESNWKILKQEMEDLMNSLITQSTQKK